MSRITQFGVEMKELQPLEANHSKLKEAFCKVLRNHPFVAKWFRSLFVQCGVFPPEVARYMWQVGSWEPQDESQLRSAAKSAFCCENFAAFLYSAMEFLLKLPDTCRKLERWEPQGGSQFRSPASLTRNNNNWLTNPKKKNWSTNT